MTIYDLTRGKYPQLRTYFSEDFCKKLSDNVFLSGIRDFIKTFKPNGSEAQIELMLDHLPIFLVESSMANEYVAIPGNECSIRVPEDCGVNVSHDFDVDAWLEQQEEDEEDDNPQNDPREWPYRKLSIADYLGVYIYEGKNAWVENKVLPQRIFIWVDKIIECANEGTSRKENHGEKANALCQFVILHEVMHALMDVNAYGVAPSPKFNYSNPIYQYVEEALANFMALNLYNNDPFTSSSTGYIRHFVENQGGGYVVGLDLFKYYVYAADAYEQLKYNMVIGQWMYIKVLFCYDIAYSLVKMWKARINAEKQSKDVDDDEFDELIQCRAKGIFELRCAKNIGLREWVAFRSRRGKWGILELNKHSLVIPCKYDDIESLKKCMMLYMDEDSKEYLVNNLSNPNNCYIEDFDPLAYENKARAEKIIQDTIDNPGGLAGFIEKCKKSAEQAKSGETLDSFRENPE